MPKPAARRHAGFDRDLVLVACYQRRQPRGCHALCCHTPLPAAMPARRHVLAPAIIESPDAALLCKRPHHAGAQTLLDKLRLLNHLLFGPGPPPRHRQFAAIPPPDGFGLEIKVSSKSFSRA